AVPVRRRAGGAADAGGVEGDAEGVPAGALDAYAAGRLLAGDDAPGLAGDLPEFVGEFPDGGVFVADDRQVGGEDPASPVDDGLDGLVVGNVPLLSFAEVACSAADDAFDSAAGAEVEGVGVARQGRGAGGGASVAAAPAGLKGGAELPVELREFAQVGVDAFAAAAVDAFAGGSVADGAGGGVGGVVDHGG